MYTYIRYDSHKVCALEVKLQDSRNRVGEAKRAAAAELVKVVAVHAGELEQKNMEKSHLEQGEAPVALLDTSLSMKFTKK